MVKILAALVAALSILNSSGASPGATETVAALVGALLVAALVTALGLDFRLGCPGCDMSLYGPTFHVTPIDFCIIFQCNLYIYPVSCLVEIKLFQIVSKIVLNCFKSFQIVSNYDVSNKYCSKNEFHAVHFYPCNSANTRV